MPEAAQVNTMSRLEAAEWRDACSDARYTARELRYAGKPERVADGHSQPRPCWQAKQRSACMARQVSLEHRNIKNRTSESEACKASSPLLQVFDKLLAGAGSVYIETQAFSTVD